MPKRRSGGPKPGPKINPLSGRDKHNASRKTRGTGDGEWKLIKGVWKLIPKK